MSEEKKPEVQEPSAMDEVFRIADEQVEETTPAESATPDEDKAQEKKPGDAAEEKPQEEPKDKDGEDAPVKVDEALLERAVRAGLSLSDAKGIQGEALERIVSRLEQTTPEKDSGEDEGQAQEKSFLDDMPEFPTDEGYPEEVGKAFGLLKDQMAKMAEKIAELSKPAESGLQKENEDRSLDIQKKAEARSKHVRNQPRNAAGHFEAKKDVVGNDSSDSDREEAAINFVASLVDSGD